MILGSPRCPHRAGRRKLGRLAGFGLALLVGCGGESKPSITEALQAKEDEQLEAIGYKASPKPRPDGLPPPTDAEFAAWNRKDPEGEKHLYKWDKANVDKMMGYWENLVCFQEKMKEEGDKALGFEPGSPQQEQWDQFKQAFIPHLDGWQKRLFAAEPRILEKSKYIGHILEAHELIMHGYPKAYNMGDKTELERNDAHWIIVHNKVKKYTNNLGGEFPELDPENKRAQEAHAKACEEALKPPERGKEKRGRGKKSPI